MKIEVHSQAATVGKMSLWLGASSVGHNPAAALRRGIPRDEAVYPRKVGALRALPKKGGISREPLEEESSARFLVGVANDATLGLL